MSGDRLIDERFRIAQERCPYPLDEDRPLPPGIPALDEEWVVADLDVWGGPHWIVPTNRRLIVLGTTGTDLVPCPSVRSAEINLHGDQSRPLVGLPASGHSWQPMRLSRHRNFGQPVLVE